MTTKHTPGPWHLSKTTTPRQFGWDYKIRSADNSAICTIGPNAQDANAALIALAPEMAETLRAIPGLMDCETYDPQDVQAMIARVTAFIDCITCRLPVSQ